MVCLESPLRPVLPKWPFKEYETLGDGSEDHLQASLGLQGLGSQRGE